MSDQTDTAVQTFLEQLAGLMGEHVALPDFDDLFLLDPGGEGGVVQVTPDDIEAFIIMGQQKAEIARQQAAEEKRLADQRDVADALKTRLDKLSEQPSPQALLIVPAGSVQDIPAVIEVADSAYRAMEQARGAPDTAFAKAAEEAGAAIDARDEAIEHAQEAVSTEVKRRQDAVDELESMAARHKQGILPEVAKLLAEKTSKARSIVNLGKVLAEAELALRDVADDQEGGTADRFDSRVETARKHLDGLPAEILKTKTVGEQKRGEDRNLVLQELRSVGRQLMPGPLEMFAGTSLVTTWTSEKSAHDKNVKALTELMKAAPEPFEVQRKAAEESYATALQAFEALSGAIRTETLRRTKEVERLKVARTKIAMPTLLNGTDEKKAYTEASDTALSTWRTANALTESKSAGVFDHAAKEAQDAVDKLATTAEDATETAKGRGERLAVRKKAVGDLFEETKTNFASIRACPIDNLAKAISDAFMAEVRDVRKRIDGVDEVADEKTLDGFRVFVTNAKTLIATVAAKLKPVDVNPVKGNVEIKAKAQTLIDALGKGIGPTASDLVEQIDNEVGKIADRYREIAALRSRYDEVIKEKAVLPAQQKVIRDFPTFADTKDDLTKGDLTKETTKFRNAIILIEQAIDKKNATTEYLASPVYKFMQLMEAGDNTTMTELQQLVTAGTATRGGITDAYRSSYDRPDAFSVEILLPIGGRPGVVIHAHCEPGGRAKPANACHVKLFRSRFDPGGIQLSGPLRAPLLHSNQDHLSKAQAKGLV